MSISALSSSAPLSKPNDFKYNGFEEQTDFDLGWFDYMARYYDPQLGRFLQVDPAADLMRRHSPYNYAFDNPIRYIDPDGMMPTDTVKQVSQIPVPVLRPPVLSPGPGMPLVGPMSQGQADELTDDFETWNKRRQRSRNGAQGHAPGRLDLYAEYLLYKLTGWPSYSPRNETPKPDGWDDMSMDEQIEWLESLDDPDFDELDELKKLKRLRAMSEYDGEDDFQGFEKMAQGDNRKKNEEVQSLYKKYGLNKDQQRRVHDIITGQGLSRKEIEKVVKEVANGGN